jgi:acetyltransferase-like isoleucine patch superfamily enzyme
VWDGVDVGNDVFLGPAMVFTNDLRPRADVKKGPAELVPTKVRDGATIGANATIVCGVTIGRRAFVAAGAVVVADVAPHALIAGNPGRRIGWVCTCGARLDALLTCPCGRSFDLVSDADGLVEL